MLTPEAENAMRTLDRLAPEDTWDAIEFLRGELERLYGIQERAWEVCKYTDALSIEGRTARYIFGGLDPDVLD